MFIVIYRWKLKEGAEDRFRQGWRAATEAISEKYGALGSRLHKAEDGTWVAYAQWPDKEHWEAMRNGPSADVVGFALMRESIDDSANIISPLFCMTVTDDHFKQRPHVESDRPPDNMSDKGEPHAISIQEPGV